MSLINAWESLKYHLFHIPSTVKIYRVSVIALRSLMFVKVNIVARQCKKAYPFSRPLILSTSA